jgi:ABC-type Fe3+-hydroxamate transport system substrate-binding protein
MPQTRLFARILSALCLATLFAACSSSGSSAKVTPSGAAGDSQTRLAQRTAGRGAVEVVYVTNFGSNNVNAYTIDTTSGGGLVLVAGSPFATGSEPWGAAVDPAGDFAYLPDEKANRISAYVINAKSGALVPVRGSPYGAGTEPIGIAACRRAGNTCKPPPL